MSSDTTDFHQRIKDADLVITGEGRMDYQTIFGKTPVGVALAAKQYHIPVIAICWQCYRRKLSTCLRFWY